MLRRSLLSLLVVLAAVFTSALASADTDPLKVLEGGVLFFGADFGGNGQKCGTCHRVDGGNPFSFGPSFAQQLYAANPNDPLFVSLNSKDAAGRDFSQMFSDGTIPIPIRIPKNVTVVAVDPGAVVYTDANGQFIYLPRKTPTVENIVLKSALMLDGREGTNLQQQAADAVATHDGPHAHLPTTGERDDIAEFQDDLFSSLQMRAFAKQGRVRKLPLGRNASEQLGRTLFDDSSPAGKCAQCHGGANLDRTSAFNIVNNVLNEAFGATILPPGLTFATNFSSVFDSVNPRYQFTWHVAVDRLTGGPMDRTLVTSDPGALLNPDANGNADPCAVDFSACIINMPPVTPVPSSQAEFVIPSLWDVGDREAAGLTFMHNGRFHSFEEVMDRLYVPFFNAVTDPGLAAITGQSFSFNDITPAERDGAIAYMRNCLRKDSPCPPAD